MLRVSDEKSVEGEATNAGSYSRSYVGGLELGFKEAPQFHARSSATAKMLILLFQENCSTCETFYIR